MIFESMYSDVEGAYRCIEWACFHSCLSSTFAQIRIARWSMSNWIGAETKKLYNYILIYRGSPLSTIFGTWKKSYYAKFVLVGSIFTSTNFHQSPPTCSNSTNTNLYQRTLIVWLQCTAHVFMLLPLSTMKPKFLWSHIIIS